MLEVNRVKPELRGIFLSDLKANFDGSDRSKAAIAKHMNEFRLSQGMTSEFVTAGRETKRTNPATRGPAGGSAAPRAEASGQEGDNKNTDAPKTARDAAAQRSTRFQSLLKGTGAFQTGS